MTIYVDPETERIIQKKILQRFEHYRDEEVQMALYEVANELRAAGREDITDQLVYQVYVRVMSF
jgi:hypothetical protein